MTVVPSYEPAGPRRLPAGERQVLLARAVQAHLASGWTLASQGELSATVVSGKPVNHTLHALLTFVGGVFTCGVMFFWGIVWFALAMSGGQRTLTIWVDEYGNVAHNEA